MRVAVLGLTLGLMALGKSAAAEDLTLAPAEPVTIGPSDYVLAPAGTTVTWRDLVKDKTLEEHIEDSEGLMMKSRIGGHRSFA